MVQPLYSHFCHFPRKAVILRKVLSPKEVAPESVKTMIVKARLILNYRKIQLHFLFIPDPTLVTIAVLGTHFSRFSLQWAPCLSLSTSTSGKQVLKKN
jgi:hypothetical protein